jgi:hypothetical protein
MEADHAEMILRNAVRDACSGEHNPTQHRDRKPPWCRLCGRDGRGVQQVPTPEARAETEGGGR